jgi:hypothetical protein
MKITLVPWKVIGFATLLIALTCLGMYGFTLDSAKIFIVVSLFFFSVYVALDKLFIQTYAKKANWFSALNNFVNATHDTLRATPKIMVTRDFSFGRIDTPYSHVDEYESIRKKYPAYEYVTKKICLPYVDGMSVSRFTELLENGELTSRQQEFVIEFGTLNAIISLAKTIKEEMPENLFDLMMKRYPAFVLLFNLNEKQIEKAIETLSLINLLGKRDSPFYPLEKGEAFIPTTECGINYCLYGAIDESHIIESKHGKTIWHVIKNLEESQQKPLKHLRKQVKEKFAQSGQTIII